MADVRRPTPKARLWLLAAILLLAFALRLYHLGAESLWYDETVSVYLAGQSIPDLIAHTARDIHPPGYYLLLHGWTRLAGADGTAGSEFAAAFLSLFFGLLLTALVYRLARRVWGPGVGLLAACLVAISPYNLWYSQEVRMYTLGAVLGLWVLGAALSLLAARPGAPPPWPRLAVYALGGALGLWTLYYFAFLLAAINLMVGAWWLAERRSAGAAERWGWLGRWALAQGAVLLLYAPWLPIAWRQATNPPVPPWRGFTTLGELLLETWSALSLGQSVEPAQVWPVLLLFALLFVLGLRARPVRASAWLLAGHVFVPVFLIYLASFVTPLYHVRYVFTSSTPFYAVVGAGLAWLGRRRRLALGLGLAVILVFSGLSIHAYHTDPRYAPDDHRAATRFLADRWRPGDAILVNAGYAYTAVVTYWESDPIAWRGRLTGDWPGADQPGAALVQTGAVDGDPSLGWGDPESDFYALSQAETEEALARLFADFDRVWVYRIYDTVTDPTGVIRRWLDDHGTRFEDRVFTGESQLRVQGFLTGRDPLADADQPRDAALADGSLRLAASSALPPSAAVGGAVDLALVWRVESPPVQDATLFAGLLDAEGRRWAQTDERPLGALYPLTAWPQGATVRTPLRIVVPPGVPPGRYRLEVGWYRFAAGQPRWLPWTAGERLALGEVEVVAPEDWWALPLPTTAYPLGVTVGEGVRLLGFDAPSLEGRPGDVLPLELVWQALTDAPPPGAVVLQLSDGTPGEGDVLAEMSAPPVDGRAPFARLAAGQTVRDPRAFLLPGDLAPGVYDLSLGRRHADGTWLPIRRGPFPLGLTYPLAAIRILGRPLNLTPPTPQRPLDARFGDHIRLLGYDLQPPTSNLQLTLHWQALSPTPTPYKIFLHLVGESGPSDIRAQADVYPRLPTTGWVAGEYLSDSLTLDLPPDLAPGRYALLLGLYDGATGQRLPVFDASGAPLGDSLLLTQVRLGQ